MQMSQLELLTKSRKRIEKPENWTQGSRAKDKNGLGCSPRSRSADRWCSIGTLECESKSQSDILWGSEERHALMALASTKRLGWSAESTYGPGTQIAMFNDNPKTTHADVMAMYDEAIHNLQI